MSRVILDSRAVGSLALLYSMVLPKSIGETSVREPRSSVVSLGLFLASRGLNADVVSFAVGFGDATIWTRGFEER